MAKGYIVRCAEWLGKGPCMRLYVHRNIKHQGPCDLCWERLNVSAKYSKLLGKVAKGEATSGEKEEFDYTVAEDFTF